MIRVKDLAELKTKEGYTFPSSEWIAITQDMINQFAEVTGDYQWIHVDEERAKKQMPQGSTIAHGFLTLSLLPKLSYTLYEVESAKLGYNYGADKLRFISPVKSESKVRMTATLKKVEVKQGSGKIYMDCVIEIEGEKKPALIYEMISMIME
ncbi:MAG: MaoC family dehydratase [Saprospiraceae bacterium]